MANFLRDYINHRGEDNVIRTQYGILDKVTGEHLVPVQHANLYFTDFELKNIKNKPNEGFIESSVELSAPIWKLVSINGVPVSSQSLVNIDGTAQTTTFTGTVEWEDGENHQVADVIFTIDGEDIQASTVNDPVGVWEGVNVSKIGTYTVVVGGNTSEDGNESEVSTLSFNVVSWREFELSQNLPASSAEYYEGATIELSVRGNTASGPTPYAYDWKKGGVSIGYSPTANTMTISNATNADGGSYSCTVTDSLGRTVDSRNQSNNVYSKMTFAHDMNDMTRYETGVLSLHFDMTGGGKTPYVYKWFKKETENGTPVEVTGSGNSLVRTNITAADAGWYAMRTISTIGGQEYFESTSYGKVDVVPFPAPVFSNLAIDGQSGSTVTVDGDLNMHQVTCDFTLLNESCEAVDFALMSGNTLVTNILSNSIDLATGKINVTVTKVQLPNGNHPLKIVGKSKWAQMGVTSVQSESAVMNAEVTGS